MQQFHLEYDQTASPFPNGSLLLPPLVAAAALLGFYGHWMLLVLAACLGLSLLHRIEQINPGPTLDPGQLKPVDGGMSSGQPSSTHPFTRPAVVSDGGSFERAL